MIDFIKKHGVPEQYPIMMLTGFFKFRWSWPWEMAKGHWKKWFWHKWKYWEVFEDHSVQVYYHCKRILGVDILTIYKVEDCRNAPRPNRHFSYHNNGHASFEGNGYIQTIAYPTGGLYPKGTKIEGDLKYGRINLPEKEEVRPCLPHARTGGMRTGGKIWTNFFMEMDSLDDKFNIFPDKKTFRETMLKAFGFKTENESEKSQNEGQ